MKIRSYIMNVLHCVCKKTWIFSVLDVDHHTDMIATPSKHYLARTYFMQGTFKTKSLIMDTVSKSNIQKFSMKNKYNNNFFFLLFAYGSISINYFIF